MDESRAYLIRIMELRAYARTKHAMDHASSESQVPSGPMADMVGEISDDLYMAQLEATARHWRAKRNRHEYQATLRKLTNFRAKVKRTREAKRRKRQGG